MSWFFTVGGEQKGPVEVAEFESLIATGVIRGETLVWQAGMPNWQAASSARPDLLPPAISPPLMYAAPVAMRNDGRRYAGFWIRFAARTIDHFALMVPIFILIGMAMLIVVVGTQREGLQNLNQTSPWVVAAALVTVLLAIVCIQAIYECYMVTRYGGTLGKLATGLTIVSLQGERLGLRQSLIRFGLYQGMSILGTIPLVGLLICIYLLADAIVLGTDARKQSLHDRFAETLVIYK